MQDFFLTDADRSFRAEVRAFMQTELAPEIAGIENNKDWDAVLRVVRKLGEAGYMKVMFPIFIPGLWRHPA